MKLRPWRSKSAISFNPMTTPNNILAALALLKVATRGHFIIGDLAGDRNAPTRQLIMGAIEGKKMAKAKCGITALETKFYAAAGITLRFCTCIADRESKFAAWAKEQIETKSCRTPGPWVYSPDRNTHDCVIHAKDAKEEFGYISPDNGGVVGSSEWIWIKPEDAILIAAAPDLLSACKRALEIGMVILEENRLTEDDEEWIPELRAAINRAEGR